MAEPVRYYLDEHVDPAIAAGLVRRGIDAITARDVGHLDIDDDIHLAYATANGRVMVTFDVDFLTLHTSGVPHAGIAWAPAGKHAIGYLVAALEILHSVYTADDMRNHLEYL